MSLSNISAFLSTISPQISEVLVSSIGGNGLTLAIRTSRANYQENLAALSPSEFYTYKVTGQYPLDNYYGIEATELMSLEQIIEAKLEMQEKKKELKRERQMINEQQSRLFTDPLEIIKRDKKKMKSEKKKWDKKLELVENQLAKLKDVLKKIDDALRFYYNEATDEIKEQLKDPLNWKNHTQLDYYKDIDALY